MDRTLLTPRRGATLALLVALVCPATGWTWGGDGHHYIARNWSQHLPPVIDGLRAYDDVVDAHVTDADTRKPYTPGEGPKHYIDIDVYPEFHAGTLPHDRGALEAIYGADAVLANGVLPWAIEDAAAMLSAQFHFQQWSAAALTIADLCHYAGDACQPLHCTVNYDGQYTGGAGLHSRYESTLLFMHLGELSTPQRAAVYLPSAREAAFAAIGASWADVEPLVQADVDGRAVDPWYDSPYYDVLWSAVGAAMRERIDAATLLTASLVYSAWVDAGRPEVPGSSSDVEPGYVPPPRLTAGPSPFRVELGVRFAGPGPLVVEVFDLRGARVARLAESAGGRGEAVWRPDGVPAGLYFLRLTSAQGSLVRRVTFLD